MQRMQRWLTMCVFIFCFHQGVSAEELAPKMASLQLYSAKLGYALLKKNEELAQFYLEELEETAEDVVEQLPEHNGIPVSKMMNETLLPLVNNFEKTLASATPDWKARWKEYEGIIAACNGCHAAAEHAFIRIRPAHGEPPYNQEF